MTKSASAAALDMGSGEALPASPLARLRLLVALDALLVEGSAGAAAQALGIGPPAMSRLLKQMRLLFNDELVTRTGKGFVPTPFAERARLRLRALSAEADDLIRNPAAPAARTPPPERAVAPLVQNPPLALSPTATIEGQPDAAHIARRRARLADNPDPKLRLARYVATTGAGVGRARPLAMHEAEDAFRIVLHGEADPVQIGALMVAMQYRGVTAQELAGFVNAARSDRPAPGSGAAADLDWPAYVSPRNMRAPWFLVAARLLACDNRRVLLHGFDRDLGNLDGVLRGLGIDYCLSEKEAEAALAAQGIAFLPLSVIDEQLRALTGLYRLFDMRSPLNLLVHLLNPLGAPATMTGVPNASTRRLFSDAAELLGWDRLLTVGANRDVAQATPFRSMPLALLRDDRVTEIAIPSIASEPIAAGHTLTAQEQCLGLWSGALRDADATAIVLSTAALGLMVQSPAPIAYAAALEQAAQMWEARPRNLPAADGRSG